MDLPNGFFFVASGTAHPIDSYWCRYEYSQCSLEVLKSIIKYLEIAVYLSNIKTTLERNRVKPEVFKQYVLIRYEPPPDEHSFGPFLRDLELEAFFEACRLGNRLLSDPLRETVINIVKALLQSARRDDIGTRLDNARNLLSRDSIVRLDTDCKCRRPFADDAYHNHSCRTS